MSAPKELGYGVAGSHAGGWTLLLRLTVKSMGMLLVSDSNATYVGHGNTMAMVLALSCSLQAMKEMILKVIHTLACHPPFRDKSDTGGGPPSPQTLNKAQ